MRSQPSRSSRPALSDAVQAKYRFGLDHIKFGVGETALDVVQGDKEIQVRVVERVIPGGIVTVYRDGDERLGEFFRYRGGPER